MSHVCTSTYKFKYINYLHLYKHYISNCSFLNCRKNKRIFTENVYLLDNPRTALDMINRNLFFDCKTICDFHRIAYLQLESYRQDFSVLLFYQRRGLETK